MRISDWSSDVCSSDLQLLRLARGILDFSVSDIGRAMLRLLAAASLQDKAFGPRYHCEQRLPLIHHLEEIFHGWNLAGRSEEHTSELQSLMRISYAVFCLKKKNKTNNYKCKE